MRFTFKLRASTGPTCSFPGGPITINLIFLRLRQWRQRRFNAIHQTWKLKYCSFMRTTAQISSQYGSRNYYFPSLLDSIFAHTSSCGSVADNISVLKMISNEAVHVQCYGDDIKLREADLVHLKLFNCFFCARCNTELCAPTEKQLNNFWIKIKKHVLRFHCPLSMIWSMRYTDIHR